MKKILIVLLLILLSGCHKEVTVEFVLDERVVYSITELDEVDISALENKKFRENEYQINGWYFEDGTEVDFSQLITESKTIIADFTKIYQVNWMANDTLVKSEKVLDGQKVIPYELPQIDNYLFRGWYDNAGKSIDEYDKYTANVTFTAKLEYTLEKIIMTYDTIYFKNASVGKKWAGVSNNMGYKIYYTSSDPSIAVYRNEFIYVYSAGTCIIKCETKSGIVKYLTIVVGE
ncbi:MAG: InlB B-repeat-containing protein [Erysipelotrichaceae bacterium]|jgi:hypothetical protein